MAKKLDKEFISCLAANYKQPITVLVERLLSQKLPDSIDDKPLQSEVDYATALVVLLVLQFEAWVSRARHFDGRPGITKDNKEHVLPWLKSLNDPNLNQIIDRLTEIYFLRDAIVHNHIWTYTQSWVQGDAHYSNFDFDFTWQGRPKKFSDVIKGKLPLPSFPRSRLLNLMIVPGFVGRKDVALIFKTIKDALKLLDDLGYLEITPKAPYVRFQQKLSFPFWNLVGEIQKSYVGHGRPVARVVPAVPVKQPVPLERLAELRKQLPARKGSSAQALRELRDAE